MQKSNFNLEKVFIFSQKALLPAVITGIFLVYFFAVSEFSKEAYEHIHKLFIATTALSLLCFGYFQVVSAVAAVSVVYVNTVVVNALRYACGEDYIFSAGYNIWIMLLPPTFLLACLIFQKKKARQYWSFFYVVLLLETAAVEYLQKQTAETDSAFFYHHIGMLNYPGLNIMLISLLFIFIYHINKGYILSALALFALFNLSIGLYFSDNLFAFSLFSLGAVVVISSTSVYYIYYNKNRDEELNIANIMSFIRYIDKKYPLKYSIVLMCIDEYPRLLKRFGYHRMIMLKKMFLDRIAAENKEVLPYNYKDDVFLLVFPNHNGKQCFEKAENIRRMIARSIFVFNENNHLQLTVTQAIGEKKRSDADATAVLQRTEKNLQKACQFTRNVTVPAVER